MVRITWYPSVTDISIVAAAAITSPHNYRPHCAATLQRSCNRMETYLLPILMKHIPYPNILRLVIYLTNKFIGTIIHHIQFLSWLTIDFHTIDLFLQCFLSLGHVVHKLSEVDLDWFGRVQLIDCICNLVLLNPQIGQVTFDTLDISSQDPYKAHILP